MKFEGKDCRSCAFSLKVQPVGYGEKSGWVVCRRFPPKSNGDGCLARFPKVGYDTGIACGEWIESAE